MIQQKLEWKKLIVLGLIAGGCQVTAGIVMYLSGIYFIRGSFFISLAVLLACVVAESRWYRNTILAGEIKFTTSLLIGVFISLSTGLLYAIYNLISVSFFYPHFLEDMVRAQISQVQSSGMDEVRAKAMIEMIKTNAVISTIALRNLLSLSIWGTGMSLITSLILKRKKS
jgi:hypothetical protein